MNALDWVEVVGVAVQVAILGWLIAWVFRDDADEGGPGRWWWRPRPERPRPPDPDPPGRSRRGGPALGHGAGTPIARSPADPARRSGGPGRPAAPRGGPIGAPR